MADQWWVKRGDKKFGPTTKPELDKLAKAGKLLPQDQILRDGDPNWQLAVAVYTHLKSPSAPSNAATPENTLPEVNISQPVQTTHSFQRRRPKRNSPVVPVVFALLGLGIVVIVLLAFSGLFEPEHQTEPRASPQQTLANDDARWKAALRSGDGNDWVSLSTRDKMALCLNAAETLGKGEDQAWAYREFLGQFYGHSNPETRGRSISETIAVCSGDD